MNLKDKKHIIFDMDGTLTESRSVIDMYMIGALSKLFVSHDVVIISGAERRQMKEQLLGLNLGTITIMAQSGNDAFKGIEQIIGNLLTFEDVHSVLLHISDIQDNNGMGEEVGGDRIEIRGGQISWSLLGHNYDKEAKRNFDPDGIIRRKFLEKTPFVNDDMMVKIGGTTCLDYTRDGWGKRGNIQTLVYKNKWSLGDCVYIGDQLYEGGNDEEVKNIMDVIQVDSPEQTLKVVNNIIDVYEKEK